MDMRVGINGFGRMGRLSVRAAWEWPEFDIVHINEIKGGPQAAAHLLEFDTVHGCWQHDIRAEDEAIRIDGKRVSFSACASPGRVLWTACRPWCLTTPRSKSWPGMITSGVTYTV